jgi:hypothetical protein
VDAWPGGPKIGEIYAAMERQKTEKHLAASRQAQARQLLEAERDDTLRHLLLLDP